MTVTRTDNTHPAHATPDPGGRSLAVAIGLFALIGLLTAAYTLGREGLRTAAIAEANAIADENDTFCRGLDLLPESPLYDKCKRDLYKIRANQTERQVQKAAGIL